MMTILFGFIGPAEEFLPVIGGAVSSGFFRTGPIHLNFGEECYMLERPLAELNQCRSGEVYTVMGFNMGIAGIGLACRKRSSKRIDLPAEGENCRLQS
jgi:hypothetical protein